LLHWTRGLRRGSRRSARALEQAPYVGIAGRELRRTFERTCRTRGVIAFEQHLAQPAERFAVARVELGGLDQCCLRAHQVAVHVPGATFEHEQAPDLLAVITLRADHDAACVAVALRGDQILGQRIRILLIGMRAKAK
jgi:hypothetical protein